MFSDDPYFVKYHNNKLLRKQFIEYASQFVNGDRLSLFKNVLSNRTKYVTVVLENLYQSQNASAVLRSCECMGVQDVHVIENYNSFEVNSEIDMSASKWLTLHKYNGKPINTADAITALKSDGYRIVATTPHKNDCLLHEFDVTKGKFALLFGTEKEGLTPTAIEMADEYIKIPMFGFIESYNISVSVALCLYDLVARAKQQVKGYQLSSDESEDVLLHWLMLSVKGSDALESRFLQINRK